MRRRNWHNMAGTCRTIVDMERLGLSLESDCEEIGVGGVVNS